MHHPRRPRVGFGEQTRYEYPHHLRAAIEDLPRAPGVYVFHGDEGDLPLYIGKSINLRSRVLSHLRTAQEARMLRQTKRVTYIRTAGEIGALLLEASMIKQQQPLLNQKLRRSRQLCSWRIRDGLPEVVFSKDVNFATTPDLYGLFSSRHAALDHLRQLADDERLCLGVLGLERLSPGKPCFRCMVKLCSGACRGDESPAEHQSRFLSSFTNLRIACWPFEGGVGLVERFEHEVQIHVIRNWCYLGSVNNLEEARRLDVQAVGFDADGYKILCKPILSGAAEIVAL